METSCVYTSNIMRSQWANQWKEILVVELNVGRRKQTLSSLYSHIMCGSGQRIYTVDAARMNSIRAIMFRALFTHFGAPVLTKLFVDALFSCSPKTSMQSIRAFTLLLHNVVRFGKLTSNAPFFVILHISRFPKWHTKSRDPFSLKKRNGTENTGQAKKIYRTELHHRRKDIKCLERFNAVYMQSVRVYVLNTYTISARFISFVDLRKFNFFTVHQTDIHDTHIQFCLP